MLLSAHVGFDATQEPLGGVPQYAFLRQLYRFSVDNRGMSSSSVTAAPNTATSRTKRIADFDAIYKGTQIRFVEKFTPRSSDKSTTLGNRALFLDRDGVLNSLSGFIDAKNDVKAMVLPEQIAAIREANQAGLRVVIVTNQGGIELKRMSPSAAVEIQKAFIDEIESAGGHVDAIYVCPRKTAATLRPGEIDARKPEPGMMKLAARELKIDLTQSFGVGDQWSDIMAFEKAGLTSILVTQTGRNADDRKDFPKDDSRADRKVSDLASAVRKVIIPATTRSSAVPAKAAQLPAGIVKGATDFVNRRGISGDEEFPQIGSGNAGITAGMLVGDSASKVVDVVRAAARAWAEPNSPLWNTIPDGVFDPSKQALLATFDSEDEVHVHLSLVEVATGKITETGLVNVDDSEVPENAPAGVETNYDLLKLYLKDALVLTTAETDHGVDIFNK